MKRLENKPSTIYDAQIIIYYCFLYKNHRIIELTGKSRILTEFLIKNNVKIIVPESIITEIKMKGFGKIISDYTSSKSTIEIIGLKNYPTSGLKYRLKTKIEGNFNKMINKKSISYAKSTKSSFFSPHQLSCNSQLLNHESSKKTKILNINNTIINICRGKNCFSNIFFI